MSESESESREIMALQLVARRRRWRLTAFNENTQGTLYM